MNEEEEGISRVIALIVGAVVIMTVTLLAVRVVYFFSDILKGVVV